MPNDVPDWLKLTQLAAPGDLGVVSIPTSQQSVTVQVNLSPFASGLVIVPQNAYDFVSWLVTGGVSTFPYVEAFAVSNPCPPMFVSIGGSTDNPVSIEAVANSVNPGAPAVVGHVYQLFGAGVSFVENSGQQPLRVRMVPQLQQLGEQGCTTAGFSSNLAAGGAATLVTGIVGQQLIVFGVEATISAVGVVVGGYQVSITDTAGALNIMRMRVQMATGVGNASQSKSMQYPLGLVLNPGTGIKLLANAGNVANVLMDGLVYYATLPYIL